MALPEAEKPGTPEWIVTFTDLMSLLLCFFVLLLTFSTPKVEKLQELRGSIAGSFGIFTGQQDDRDTEMPPNPTIQGRDEKNPFAPTQMPRFRPLEDNEPNTEFKRLKDQTGAQIEWDAVIQGARVRIGRAVSFTPGTNELTPESFIHIEKIAKALEYVPHFIAVIGYIGNEEFEQVRANDHDPMELAIARAVKVVGRLVDNPNVSAENLGVAGYGPDPANPGEGRVELVIFGRSKVLRGR